MSSTFQVRTGGVASDAGSFVLQPPALQERTMRQTLRVTSRFILPTPADGIDRPECTNRPALSCLAPSKDRRVGADGRLVTYRSTSNDGYRSATRSSHRGRRLPIDQSAREPAR